MKIRLNPIDRLIQTLRGQRTVYAALVSLYHKHESDISEMNLAAIKPMLLEEQRLLKELGILEQHRLTAVSRLWQEIVGEDSNLLEESQLLQGGASPVDATLVNVSKPAAPTMPINRQISHKELLLLLQNYEANAKDFSWQQQVKELEVLGDALASIVAEVAAAREPLLPLLQSALTYIERSNRNQSPRQTPYGAAGKPSDKSGRQGPTLDRKV